MINQKIRRFCICCEKPLKSSFPFGDEDYEMDITTPPDDGVYLHTSGNWGSRIYDSMAGMYYLEMAICDDCLVLKAAKGFVIEAHKLSKDSVDVEYFNPKNDMESRRNHCCENDNCETCDEFNQRQIEIHRNLFKSKEDAKHNS